ncbi:MAG: extracellular solute-binding protein [Armatimonadetes bacterium]|nr:extracellular solute-binding protein [Armatimonadota bacterium]NIM24130.1 extracellular solute-binding protein [Armatimonadota bacterium]NIM67985.1 extracellular solute-binding protein [Armatimonadota bacterium]NIN06212.1 extracellular solute-binding protein [Armatimonadota bacterium]NIO97684.1 extracellular solute-binding protein [Armatimonadota bacterium]
MLKMHLLNLVVCLALVLENAMALAAPPAALIDKAKAEGELSFYTSMNIGESRPLLDAFQNKYPFIKAQLTRIGGTAIATRMLTEARAGQHLWDASAPTMLYAREVLKRGLVAPYASSERAAYRREFKDTKNLWTGIVLNTSVMVYNTQLLKPNEYPKNYDDLLHPRFKGKKISMDTELYLWYAGQLRIRGKEKGLEFMRKLKAQEPVFRRGRTAQAQAVIAGEMLVAVEIYGHRAQAFKAAGAPLDWVAVEPVLVLPLALMLNKNAPHPHTARLFIDFALSKQGQEILRDHGRIPARSDMEIDPPGLLKNDWQIEVIGLKENLTKLVKEYSQLFELDK